MEFTVVQGDIAEQEADAIVDEADTGLGVSGGIGVSVWEHAGREVLDDAIEEGPVGLGQVVVTDGYDLDADYVIHAAVMPNYGDRKATKESIEQATRHALEAADDRDCASLAIPALGCGVGDMDIETGATVICHVIDEYDPDSLETVQFVAYEDEECKTVQRIADDIRE